VILHTPTGGRLSANYVEIAKATLHLDNGEVRWDPVDFSYGPVKGTATDFACRAPRVQSPNAMHLRQCWAGESQFAGKVRLASPSPARKRNPRVPTHFAVVQMERGLRNLNIVGQ